MPKRRGSLASGIVGLALILLAHIARPLLGPQESTLAVFWGSLPNFGAALMLPYAIASALGALGGQTSRGIQSVFAVCIMAFASLAFWESIQLLAWGYPFDWKDILASGFGVALVWLADKATARKSWPASRRSSVA